MKEATLTHVRLEWLVGGLAVSFVVLNLTRSYFTTSAEPLLLALGALQLLPILLDLSSGKTRLLSYVLVIHFLYTCFAKLILVYVVGEPLSTDEPFRWGLIEQFRCTLIILTTYYALAPLFPSLESVESAPLKKMEVSPAISGIILLWIFLIPFGMTNLKALGAIPSYLNFLSITLALTTIPSGFGRIYSRLLPLLAPYLIFDFLRTGMMTHIGLFSFLFVISCLLERERKAIPYASMVIFLLFVLQLAKPHLRAVIWYQEETASFSDRSQILLDAMTEASFLDVDETTLAYAESLVVENDDTTDERADVLDRINEDILARVLEYTPQRVPFLKGETYEQLLYMFVPRLIWQNKPQKFSGNTFGRMYNLIGEDNFSTSVSMPILPEGYINFGYAGLYGVAFILALLILVLQVLQPVLLGGHYSLSFLIVFLPLVRYEHSLSQCLYAAVALVGFALALRFLGLRGRAASGRT